MEQEKSGPLGSRTAAPLDQPAEDIDSERIIARIQAGGDMAQGRMNPVASVHP
jgi:hypothetical protein